jgi:hypothetical protein
VEAQEEVTCAILYCFGICRQKVQLMKRKLYMMYTSGVGGGNLYKQFFKIKKTVFDHNTHMHVTPAVL